MHNLRGSHERNGYDHRSGPPALVVGLMKRRFVILVLFLLFFFVVVAFFHEYLTLHKLIEHEEQLRQFVVDHPLVAPITGFVVYVFLSLVPGTAGKSIVYGWLFGFWWALVQVNLGLTISATTIFLFSRYMFRDVIQEKFGYYLLRLNEALRRDGPYLVLMLRLLHAPYTFVNYAMGATPLRTRTFWWTSQLGMLPGNVLFVLAGTQLPTLKQLEREGVHSVFTPTVVISFLALALFPVAVRFVLRRFFPRAENDADLA